MDQDWSTLTDNFELETGSGNKQVDGSSQNITFITEQLATYSESKLVTEETSSKPILTTIETPPLYQAVNESNENIGIFLPDSDFDEIDSSNIEFTDDVFILSRIESDLSDHKYFTYIDPKHFAQLNKTTQNSMTTDESPLFTVPAEAWQIDMALEIDDIKVTSMANFDNLTPDETNTEASKIDMALEIDDIEVTSMANFDNLTPDETNTEASKIDMALEINDIEVTSMVNFGNLTTDETTIVPTTTSISNGDFDDLPFTIPDDFVDVLDDLIDLSQMDSRSDSCSSRFCNVTEWASHDKPSGTGDHERFRLVKIKINYRF